ncbi:hypothetical protein PS631_00271 [Pseudomonas fluorescens]|jgi:hypothetical protein|uniref:Uncharacterized protein n=1 Tax=Pseudomonas fluorescens TaxID=294 RepID=A0A5E6PEI1_PSEFL|nr:hypothetical protein PS631_00271 [Pseudomonas fluorescens]
MNGEAIQSDTLSALVSQHAIRETVVGRVAWITTNHNGRSGRCDAK